MIDRELQAIVDRLATSVGLTDYVWVRERAETFLGTLHVDTAKLIVGKALEHVGGPVEPPLLAKYTQQAERVARALFCYSLNMAELVIMGKLR